jgi:uncharacterized membrane protein (UPF0136 family)
MLVGGIIGFKKAQSKASLLSGVISAIFLGTCYWQSLSNPFWIQIAFLIIGALDGVFLVRLIKTKKFMPAGLMLILCIIEQTILVGQMLAPVMK